ncbi:MAG TPA: ABC transporter permease, partial [Motiliproteus sp.]
MSPINQRRLARFRANKRGYWSLWIFLALFFLSLGAELIANDRPVWVQYQGDSYWPLWNDYPETTFGGDFETATDYTDSFIIEQIKTAGEGSILWPLIRFSYDTINYNLDQPAPSPP